MKIEQAPINIPSSRLIVLIHGINSFLLCSKYIQELSKNSSSTNYLLHMSIKRYYKVKEAALPIYSGCEELRIRIIQYF
jgi:hypothetical protein